MYKTKKSCFNGINSIVESAKNAVIEDQTVEEHEVFKNPKFEIYNEKSGAFVFRLKARNGQVILISKQYKNKKGAWLILNN